MKDYGGQSRRERFEALDKPYAQRLPQETFRITKIKTGVRVAPNYHIQYEKHYYSVPHELVRHAVDVYQTGGILEIYHDGRHLCRHPKQKSNYGYTTNQEHMPANYRFVKGWSQEYFLRQAAQIGAAVLAVEEIIRCQKHPEHGYRAALGVLRLARTHSAEPLERACARVLHFRMVSYRSIKSVLQNNLESEPLDDQEPSSSTAFAHGNLRGSQYYSTH